MTIPEFRANADLVVQLRSAMDLPVMKIALQLLKDSNPAIDALPSSDALVSVRMLSQMAGYATFHATLMLLAEPMSATTDIPSEFKPEE